MKTIFEFLVFLVKVVIFYGALSFWIQKAIENDKTETESIKDCTPICYPHPVNESWPRNEQGECVCNLKIEFRK